MIRILPFVNGLVDRRHLLTYPFFGTSTGTLTGEALLSVSAAPRGGLSAEIPAGRVLGATPRGGLAVEFPS